MEIVSQKEDNHQYGVQALTRSQQDRLYEPTENGATDGYKIAITSIAPTHTYILPSIAPAAFENARYSYLTSKKGDSDTNLDAFWLASRCVYDNNGSYVDCSFGLQVIGGGGLGFRALAGNRGGAGQHWFYIRPMVEIPLENVTMPTSGAGTSAQPYVMF